MRLVQPFSPQGVNDVLGIHWAGTFLPKHRVGNPGGYTELFVQVSHRPAQAEQIIFSHGENRKAGPLYLFRLTTYRGFGSISTPVRGFAGAGSPLATALSVAGGFGDSGFCKWVEVPRM